MMSKAAISIVPFEPGHQPGINLLFQSIQQEFPEQMFPDPSQTIAKLSHSPNRHYWVALADQKVVATAGLLYLAVHNCCLKSLFLAKEFRGDQRGIAVQLLEIVIGHAKENGCTMICLGTMAQFAGAQRFYEKNGFVRIEKEQLPADFPANVVDTMFYSKEI
jgi:N-acetylglutamate synthase-like GNAT family acetyltransferase